MREPMTMEDVPFTQTKAVGKGRTAYVQELPDSPKRQAPPDIDDPPSKQV